MSQAITDKKAYELFGDGVPPQSTRQKILFTAMDLFYVHGFHAVGVDRIIAEVGLTKTTFYNHFPSKDDLIIEVIETREVWETQAFIDQIESAADGDPRRMLIGVFDALDLWFRSPDFKGCAFLNACIEFPSPNDPIHRTAVKHMWGVEEWLTELATQAGSDEPLQLAREFTVLIEGTLVTRHAMGRDDAAQVAKRVAEGVLERYLPLAAG